MSLDLSRIQYSSGRKNRFWHSGAFIVEALVLLVFLLTSIAIVTQVLSGAREHSASALELSCSAILASNDAETFAADPRAGDVDTYFCNREGELVEIESNGQTIVEPSETIYHLTRTVSDQVRPSGTFFTAHISVSCDEKVVYEVETARYVSNKAVQ